MSEERGGVTEEDLDYLLDRIMEADRRCVAADRNGTMEEWTTVNKEREGHIDELKRAFMGSDYRTNKERREWIWTLLDEIDWAQEDKQWTRAHRLKAALVESWMLAGGEPVKGLLEEKGEIPIDVGE